MKHVNIFILLITFICTWVYGQDDIVVVYKGEVVWVSMDNDLKETYECVVRVDKQYLRENRSNNKKEVFFKPPLLLIFNDYEPEPPKKNKKVLEEKCNGYVFGSSSDGESILVPCQEED